MKNLLLGASLSILLLIVGVVQAESITGTASWTVNNLRDNSGAEIIGLVLDYQYNPELETIPVNGYVVIKGGGNLLPSLVHGTAMMFGNQESMLIYLNDLTLGYYVATDGTFNGSITVIDETGKSIGSGSLTFLQ